MLIPPFSLAVVRGGKSVREKLTTSRTYYVRTDGSDFNDGLSDSSGGAFQSLSRAVSAATSLDSNGNFIRILVGDGDYGELVLYEHIGGQPITIMGNKDHPERVRIHGVGAAVFAYNAGAWLLGGMTVQAQNGPGILCHGTTTVTLIDSFAFGEVGGAHMYAFDGASLHIACPWRITGNCIEHMHIELAGRMSASWQTCTLVDNPSVGCFVRALDCAVLTIKDAVFEGTATGQRYDIRANAVVRTDGAGADYLPGDAAGDVSSGGQYA